VVCFAPMVGGKVASARVVGFLALIGVGGCRAHSSFEPTATPPHALQAKDVEDVRVVRAPAHADGVEVGHIEVSSKPHVHSDPREEVTLELVRASAAEHGCDSVEVEPADSHLYATSNGTPLYKSTQRARCFVKP
jgi:hypothetical protein